MFKLLLRLSLIFLSFNASAIQTDTSAYQTQRLKVNALLNERSAKFGQYDQSLDKKTGIFGFQTKDDIKNSNEILRQIVLNDNNIFKELKILMDYKDQEVKKAKDEASTTEGRAQNYMVTIKNLQTQNQKLQEQIDTQQNGKGWSTYIIAFLLLSLFVISYLSYKNAKRT